MLGMKKFFMLHDYLENMTTMIAIFIDMEFIQDKELKVFYTNMHGCAYVTLCNGSIRLQIT